MKPDEPKLLVVNADDMGLAVGVNRGIEEAIRCGFVHSVSVMTVGGAFEDALARLRGIDEASFGVGVHLVGTLRKPILSPVRIPGIVEEDGNLLRTRSRLLAALVQGKARMSELEAELAAQVDRAADAGLRLDHLDCHLSLQALPPILDVVVRIARRHAIPFVRRLKVNAARSSGAAGGGARHLLETTMARALGSLLDRRLMRDAGVRTSDALYGLSPTTGFPEQVRAILDALHPGLNELFCHPGRVDDSTRSLPRPYPGWEAELAAITDPELLERAKERGIRLASYHEAAQSALAETSTGCEY